MFFHWNLRTCRPHQTVTCYILQGKNCYGAKGHKFGSVEASISGYITSITLQHQTGYLSCSKRNKKLRSLWECNRTNSVVNFGTWITTNLNRKGVLFPNKGIRLDKNKFYTLLGFVNNKSKRIVLPVDNFKVNEGQHLRVWYGEDLFRISERNNAGKSCVEVWTNYANYKP